MEKIYGVSCSNSTRGFPLWCKTEKRAIEFLEVFNMLERNRNGKDTFSIICKETETVKAFGFGYSPEEIKKVFCKHDGHIAYCNSLGMDGVCMGCYTHCENAVAMVVEKNGVNRFLALDHSLVTEMKFIVELANGENIKVSKEEVKELVPSKGFKLGRIVLKNGETYRLHPSYTASRCIWFLDITITPFDEVYGVLR